ncbi:BTB/POZ domain-containing protein At3g05675-like [Triticum dicoccoides]|uniref:BTB/POZ domain-containing protein At3g05675-like n=1 Tax=Triticum dicoccoides TaxID=85692 RepID=UPI001890B433|nr:BTB/POZ domain-containing protein At3g05675-like [Triticum dicoccoides]
MRAAARPKIGDRATSDVVVRLRTPDSGRDEWLYCHSRVLAAGSAYFADRLSDAWPTCQILDSRYCVEVHCRDADLSSHVTALRLLYAAEPVSRFGVRGALSLLDAAAHLACARTAAACADYLESAPWDEADEEEILAAAPRLGAHRARVLARLRPADPAPATAIFLSAFRHATAAPSAASRELKPAAQEQLEYMLTEDDDAPLLAFGAGSSDAVKSQVKGCVTGLLNSFSNFTSSALTKQREAPCSGELQQDLHSFVSDIAWVCQVLGKLEMMKFLAAYWVEASSAVVAAVEAAAAECHPGPECLKTRLKVVEISAKVLEAVAFGNVVLPAEKRRHAVSVWIGFAGTTRHLVDEADRGNDDGDGEDEDGNNGDGDTEAEAASASASAAAAKIGLDGEVWQGLESAITSIVTTLPSNTQAEVLSEWLQSKHAAFPDLSEAFDAWCYRSKVARRRLSFLNSTNRAS